jgi:taurine dioxygenase
MNAATGSRIDVTALTPRIGGLVSGFDPAVITDADRAALRAAWHRYHVLVLRDAPLSEDVQVDFASSFGPVLISKAMRSPLGVRPEIMIISNIRDDDGAALGSLPDGEMDWHYDGLHQPTPYTGGILHAIEVPPTGGETRFANMCSVCASLPDVLKEKLTGLTALNIYDYTATDRSMKVRDEKAPRAVQPVVRRHEVTGEDALFVCRLMTERIRELPEAESEALLEELFGYIERCADVYVHAWRPWDTVVWDNRCVTHARNDFDPGQRRLLKRVSVRSSLQ